MLTQIYEIASQEEARSICEIGIDHIGVLVGNGEFPRELSLETAATIAGAVRPPSKLSALFLTADISLIEQWARKLQPVVLHLARLIHYGVDRCQSAARIAARHGRGREAVDQRQNAALDTSR